MKAEKLLAANGTWIFNLYFYFKNCHTYHLRNSFKLCLVESHVGGCQSYYMSSVSVQPAGFTMRAETFPLQVTYLWITCIIREQLMQWLPRLLTRTFICGEKDIFMGLLYKFLNNNWVFKFKCYEQWIGQTDTGSPGM